MNCLEILIFARIKTTKKNKDNGKQEITRNDTRTKASSGNDRENGQVGEGTQQTSEQMHRERVDRGNARDNVHITERSRSTTEESPKYVKKQQLSLF